MTIAAPLVTMGKKLHITEKKRQNFMSGPDFGTPVSSCRSLVKVIKQPGALALALANRREETARIIASSFGTCLVNGTDAYVRSCNLVLGLPRVSGNKNILILGWLHSNNSFSTPDLSMFPQRQTPVGSRMGEPPHKIPRCNDYNHMPPGTPTEVSNLTSAGDEITTSVESSSGVPRFKWHWKRRVALLRLYTIYKKELSASNIDEQTMWEKIAEKVGKQSPHCPDSKEVRNQIQEIKSEYERMKHNKPTDQFSATVLDEAENAFEDNENQVVFSLQSNLEKVDMSKQEKVKLLQVYAKYKAEISLQKFDAEMQILWGKVAREVSKCSSFYGKRRCCYEINNIKAHYERLKKNPQNSTPLPFFYDEARKAFESTECAVPAVPQSSSNASLPSFSWSWKKRLALLRVYSIFKKELSSSNSNGEDVWKKISQRVGRHNPQCDAEQCRKMISDLKSECERMKIMKPYESNELDVVFVDEAENAFEDNENQYDFSVQSDLENWAMSKQDRVKLLQVYAKYKAEITLQNFDAEMQIVWDKVAREVSKMCSSFYGKRRCCNMIHGFKKRYEKQSGKKDFLFDELSKTFGAT